MVGRKSKPLQIIEDVASANIQLRCPGPECGHEFFKKGAWLEKNYIFGCPKCRYTITLNDDELRRLFDNHVQKLRNIVNRSPGKPTE